MKELTYKEFKSLSEQGERVSMSTPTMILGTGRLSSHMNQCFGSSHGCLNRNRYLINQMLKYIKYYNFKEI